MMHLCLALRGETWEFPGLTDKPVSSGKSELWVQDETLSQNTRLDNDMLTYENVCLYTHEHTLTHEVIVKVVTIVVATSVSMEHRQVYS